MQYLPTIVLNEGPAQLVVVIGVNLGHWQHSIPFERLASHGVLEIAGSAGLIPISGLSALLKSFQPLISSELVLLVLCVKERQLGLLNTELSLHGCCCGCVGHFPHWYLLTLGNVILRVEWGEPWACPSLLAALRESRCDPLHSSSWPQDFHKSWSVCMSFQNRGKPWVSFQDLFLLIPSLLLKRATNFVKWCSHNEVQSNSKVYSFLASIDINPVIN